MKFSVACALFSILFAYAQSLIFEPAGDPDVQWRTYSQDTQLISFDENNKKGLKLAKIVNVTTLPDIGLLVGYPPAFQYEVVEDFENVFTIVLNSVIDFEQNDCQEFMLAVTVLSESYTYYLDMDINDTSD